MLRRGSAQVLRLPLQAQGMLRLPLQAQGMLRLRSAQVLRLPLQAQGKRPGTKCAQGPPFDSLRQAQGQALRDRSNYWLIVLGW